MSGILFPKPRAAALDKADRRAAITARDAAESKAVKSRSAGRCEVVVTEYWRSEPDTLRCKRLAVEVNHLLGGHGVRGRGESAKAIRKIHMCKQCHSDYHAHTLRRVGDVVPRFDDPYERVT